MNTPLTFSTAAAPDQKSWLTKKAFPAVMKALPVANRVLPVAATFVPALRPVAAVVGAISSLRR
jgi:hypothetical protein